MKSKSLFSTVIFVVIMAIGFLWASSVYTSNFVESMIIIVATFIIAILISSSIKISDPWDRAVVLRLGQFKCLKGPGLFFIVPIIDNIPYVIDTRVITTSFKADNTLTNDTVPVDVDAVVFWKVFDPK